MIPNIFVSSTIEDLTHLRDSVRDLISDLGYNPVMSEYGDIGYLPNISAQDSCYSALKNCHLAIFIIGKRYGSIASNGLSVTHNEFNTAKENNIPIIFLVSEDVLSFMKVKNVNKKTAEKIKFPGMEKPLNVFEFIKEFSDYEINNGLVSFNNVQSATNNLKRQIAFIFGDLLKKEYDPVQKGINDVLSDIATLKHYLLKDEKVEAYKVGIAFRFILDMRNKSFANLIEGLFGNLSEIIPEMIKYNSFIEFLKEKEVKNELVNEKEEDEIFCISNLKPNLIDKRGVKCVSYGPSTYGIDYSEENKQDNSIKTSQLNKKLIKYAFGNMLFIYNNVALLYFEKKFTELLKKINQI
jgi:hypothetical protein